MISRRRRSAQRSGCGLLVQATVITCALLVLNRIVVASLYAAVVPPNAQHPKLRTVVSMLAIIGLLVPEWWLLDAGIVRLRRVLRGLVRPSDQENGRT